MEKVVKIISLRDRGNDYAFWMTKTEQERIDAIELLRSFYIKSNFNVEPRLQKVCTIINKKNRVTHCWRLCF
jgi:hypothetical protein